MITTDDLKYLIFDFCLTHIGKRILMVSVLISSMLFIPYALADAGCTATTSSGQISFGQVSSLNIRNSQQSASTKDMGLNCGGGILSLLSVTGKISAHITTSNTAVLKNQLGDSMPYSMYMTPDYQYQIQPNTTVDYYNGTILGLLGLGNSNSVSIPLYLRTNSGTFNLRAGTYTDTITVNWDWKVCKGVSILFICLGYSQGQATWVGHVSLNVQNDCMINAPDINFGSVPLTSSFNPVSQTISIYCTKGTSYSVGLSNGSNVSGNQRRLAYNGHYLNYEIYQGSTSNLRWGTSGSERRFSANADINPGVGSGSNSLIQGFIYQAIILPGQATPPAGTYTDRIILDISF